MEPGISVSRVDLESSERFQLLRRELGVSTFGLSVIRLRPGQRGRIHRHLHQEEVFLVLDGRLTIVAEGEERDLGIGEVCRVAPDIRRQILNRGPHLLVLLAIGGANEHESRDGVAYASWDDQDGLPPAESPVPDDLPTSELRSE